MTVVFVFALCIAGFVVGFVVIYTIRRGYIKVKSASREIVSNMEETPCLWCGKQGYSATNPSFICPKCGTMHHRSCWEEYGGCTTWECPLAPVGEKTKEVA
ncbi:MAG: hypothetical protein A2025_01055 [Chloroflexi bacterium RBG_19FT_COMBO_47_15]|nr:MAG: hypothetical protein A2025_01055 [Chloroflexi bacterium RBG_19FT_COMBO_47_15]